jgi:DNA-binding beta-propeller fold protein YncE
MMRRKVPAALLLAGAITVALCGHFGGCDGEIPVKYVEPAEKYYVVYFCDYYDEEYDEPPLFYAYHPDGNVLDTFSLPLVPSREMTVSADGSLLYVTTENSVAVVDLATREVTLELPYAAVHEVAVSSDGRMVALMDLIGGGLRILRTSDYSVIYQDTADVPHGEFSGNCKRFYYSVWSGSRFEVCVVALDSLHEVFRRGFTYTGGSMNITQVQPSADEEKWFLYASIGGGNAFFLVYDCVGDTITFWDHFTPGRGEFEITADEEYVFYTSPGGMIGNGPPPPYAIMIYDVGNNEVSKEISTLRQVNDTLTDFLSAGEICITPDNKWLVAISRYGQDTIIIIDIETMEIERYLELGSSGYPLLSGPTCQKCK